MNANIKNNVVKVMSASGGVPALREDSVGVKKEPLSPAASSSDEIKQEFAETAMNELLGWYGYEGTGGNSSGGAPVDEIDIEDEEIPTRKHLRHLRQRLSGGDSSGPEYSDSGGSKWCKWCNRPIPHSGDQTPTGFCSELCFAQSRRASFKRNRTCDWCRHVRHTVAHVDVRDGARHLQFCSDKCLNQYKMHIFCRETQAHLDLHPHSHQLPTVSAAEGGLITPELWMKDCRNDDEVQAVERNDTALSNGPATTPHQNNTSPHPRKKLCTVSRKVAARRAVRTSSTVTSTLSTCQSASEPEVPEVPQDLSTRPRSRDNPETNISDTQKPTNPSIPFCHPVESLQDPPKPTWPPPPPPITILVPYPVLVPIPLPLPLPIPIPISQDIFKKFTSNSTDRKSVV